jgi:cell division control protein 45
MKPVSSYTMLGEIYENDIKDNPELKSVLLIGCGALVDLSDTFPDFDEGDAAVNYYIIDPHRPVNLANLYSSEQIFVFADEDLEKDMNGVKDAFVTLNVCVRYN